MKKIQILKSNNQILNNQINFLQVPDEEELNTLRSYIVKETDLLQYSEPEIFFKTMKYVHSAWKHDGINNPGDISSLEILKRALKGENFRCVEYAKVTRDILLSLGYIARSVGIQSENADYGGLGQSHFVTEVWSNEKMNWVFLDPQANCYAMIKDNPVSYYDIYKNFKDVTFVFEEPLSHKLSYLEEYYKKFIQNYMGYIKINGIINENKIDLYLHLNGKRQLLAFQAMDLSKAVFTNRSEDIYFDPNRTLVLFEYKEKVDAVKVIKENNLKTMKDMEDNLHLFSTKPDFILYFETNTLNHHYYELQINDGDLIKIKTNQYEWNVRDGVNYLRVCSVNKQGIRGCFTNIQIFYGEMND